jgi:hypothetical protein
MKLFGLLMHIGRNIGGKYKMEVPLYIAVPGAITTDMDRSKR